MDPYCYRMSSFYTCIKITNLNPQITAQELMNIFEECGDIVSIRISKNFNGNKWAIINFGETEAVLNAELYSGTILDGRIVNVYGCMLGRNDFDYTEEFYFGRTLPLSKKEKETIDNSRVYVTSNGKTYLVHIQNEMKEMIDAPENRDSDKVVQFQINVNSDDNSLYLKEIDESNETNDSLDSIEELEKDILSRELELKQLATEYEREERNQEYKTRQEYDQNFELMKEDMKSLDKNGYIELPFMTLRSK